ncbi:MAG TPA: hypothetical protein VKR54_03055 [Candidatus Babeliales bacterium]|jgi:hypothetical protein|nr:hypothetical protein [Candidatus Babeliales bacterium]
MMFVSLTNKKINLLLPLFLFSFLFVHSMKRRKLASFESKFEHSYIEKLQNGRDFLKYQILEDENDKSLRKVYQGWLGPYVGTRNFFEAIYRAEDENKAGSIIDESYRIYPSVQRQIHEYSALGITTMSFNLSYQAKNNIVQKLFMYGVTPTLKDKNLAFLEKWERVPFKKMPLVRYVAAHTLGIVPEEFPYEVVIIIAELMVDIEKLLF